MTMAKLQRALIEVQASKSATDGDGVKIQRSVASHAMHTYDPFLLLDEIASDEAADYIGGFPEHPHRGFETVTYMLEGSMRHRDNMGNEGLLVSGSVQWMTAGRGVLHSEMPMQESGRLHGFQLWINLPAAEKMSPPSYRDYGPGDIPLVPVGRISSARVIAGTLHHNQQATNGPITDVSTQPDYFDIELAAGDTVRLSIDADKRVMLYVYQGDISITSNDQPRPLATQQLGILGYGDEIEISSDVPSRCLLLAGMPIGEPIANWGPFVMNTREEIDQAIREYQEGTLARA
jgi:hypothetical protein